MLIVGHTIAGAGAVGCFTGAVCILAVSSHFTLLALSNILGFYKKLPV